MKIATLQALALTASIIGGPMAMAQEVEPWKEAGLSREEWMNLVEEPNRRIAEQRSRESRARLEAYRIRLEHVNDPERVKLLGRIHDLNLPANRVVPIFGAQLDSEDDRLRESALQWLAQYGRAAGDYTPRVLEVLQDPQAESYLYPAAIRALGRIADPDNDDVVAALSAILQQRQGRLAPYKAEAIESLGLLGPPAAPAVDVIEAYLSDQSEEPSLKFPAFVAVSRIRNPEPIDRAALELDVALLSRPDSYTIYLAIQDAGDATKQQAAPILLSILDSQPPPPSYLRAACIETLGKMPSYEPRAVYHMLQQVNAAALQSMAPQHREAIPVLVNALDDPSGRVRRLAARKLSIFRQEASDAVGPVVERLRNSDASTDLEELGDYVQLVRAIGPAAKPAASLIATWLPEQSPIYDGRNRLLINYFRGYLLETLSHIGVPESALPYIVDGLVNSDYTMAHMYVGAARAAGGLGASAGPCVPGLIRSLTPPAGETGYIMDFVTFDKFLLKWHPDNIYTTPQIEAIRALARIGAPAGAALPRLRELASGHPWDPDFDESRENERRGYTVPDIEEEARRAVVAIEESANEQ